MSLVSASGIRYAYGDRVALDGFDLEVPAGSVFGVLGPNGSGKSTFISLLAAMERPAAGSLTVFGQDPAPALRARIGTVFQENASDPLMRVNELLGLSGRLFGLSRGEVATRSRKLLEAFGLGDRARDGVMTLSGGMRRRLEMARALLHDPELLLLDEPTTGVDVDERRALWSALLETRGQRTILLATNDLAEADTTCDHVAFVRHGQVVVAGAPADLKKGLRRETLRVEWTDPSAADLAAVEAWPGVGSLSRDGDAVHISVDEAAALVPRLFEVAPGAIRSVAIHPSTLEDAYLHHVGSRTAPAEVPA